MPKGHFLGWWDRRLTRSSLQSAGWSGREGKKVVGGVEWRVSALQGRHPPQAGASWCQLAVRLLPFSHGDRIGAIPLHTVHEVGRGNVMVK